MNKEKIFLVIGLVGWLLILSFGLLKDNPKLLSGISLQNPEYATSNLTYGSVICQSNSVAGATGTAIVAAAPGRLHFSALNPTIIAGVYLCRSGIGCGIATSTILISATTSVNLPETFDQSDRYTGAYTCLSDGATTTISYNQAQ